MGRPGEQPVDVAAGDATEDLDCDSDDCAGSQPHAVYTLICHTSSTFAPLIEHLIAARCTKCGTTTIRAKAKVLGRWMGPRQEVLEHLPSHAYRLVAEGSAIFLQAPGASAAYFRSALHILLRDGLGCPHLDLGGNIRYLVDQRHYREMLNARFAQTESAGQPVVAADLGTIDPRDDAVTAIALCDLIVAIVEEWIQEEAGARAAPGG
jgi:hypothetical protein